MATVSTTSLSPIKNACFMLFLIVTLDIVLGVRNVDDVDVFS